MITTTTTLKVKTEALQAAEHLRKTLHLLNAADGDFAYAVPHLPYGMTEKALEGTLGVMFEDPSNTGDPEHDQRIKGYVDLVMGECVNNGENVQYQITHVLGWDLVITEDGNNVRVIPAAR